MALRYRPELDGLRAIAVLAVMGCHFVSALFSGGTLGVDVFFVLSGFLITSILVAEQERDGRIDYPAFLMRRIRRLLPALALLLAVYWALCPLLWPDFGDQRNGDVITAFFYLTNLRQSFWPDDNPLSHSWSLAIEEQYYLIWPWVIPALARIPRPTAAMILCGLWTVLTAARFVWWEFIGGPGTYYFTPLHSTGLLLGSALALHPVKTGLGKIALAALVAIFLVGQTHSTFLYLIPIAEILTILVIADAPALLAARPLRFLGRISYGVYLWHIPIVWALGVPGNMDGVTAVLALLLSIAAGALSHFGLEQWFVQRRRTASMHTEPLSLAR